MFDLGGPCIHLYIYCFSEPLLGCRWEEAVNKGSSGGKKQRQTGFDLSLKHLAAWYIALL